MGADDGEGRRVVTRTDRVLATTRRGLLLALGSGALIADASGWLLAGAASLGQQQVRRVRSRLAGRRPRGGR